MSRLKTFRTYLILFVLFYIFVSVMSVGFIKGTYKKMEGNIQKVESLSVDVSDAQSTMVNGYIVGTLTNNTQNNTILKYVKIDFISSRENKILTKYIKVDELKSGETKNFTINFRAENIKSYNITIVDEYVQEKSDVNLINLQDAENEEVKKAVETLNRISLDPKERERYESIIQAEFNHKISNQKFFEKGEKKKQIEIAKKLLSKNIPIDEIIEITDLTKEEVENLSI
ncbi:MAG: hypothetical protein ACI4VQ_04375, partial [Clostridia bacterium]